MLLLRCALYHKQEQLGYGQYGELASRFSGWGTIKGAGATMSNLAGWLARDKAGVVCLHVRLVSSKGCTWFSLSRFCLPIRDGCVSCIRLQRRRLCVLHHFLLTTCCPVLVILAGALVRISSNSALVGL